MFSHMSGNQGRLQPARCHHSWGCETPNISQRRRVHTSDSHLWKTLRGESSSQNGRVALNGESTWYSASRCIPAIRSLPQDLARTRSAGIPHTDCGPCGDDSGCELRCGGRHVLLFGKVCVMNRQQSDKAMACICHACVRLWFAILNFSFWRVFGTSAVFEIYHALGSNNASAQIGRRDLRKNHLGISSFWTLWKTSVIGMWEV
jgi:hypothetical protein